MFELVIIPAYQLVTTFCHAPGDHCQIGNVITARKRSLRRLCFYRCLSVHTGGGHAWFYSGGGHAWFYLGGVHGFIWGGVHGFIWGRAWFYLGGVCGFIWGACMVLFRGCMVLSGGHVWFYLGGMCGFIQGGMCGFIRGGMHGFIQGGHAWFFQFFQIQSDTVNEQAVCILLECILVVYVFTYVDLIFQVCCLHIIYRSVLVKG